MKHLCIVTTMWSSINYWITPFLDDLNKNDIDITVVCKMDSSFEEDLKRRYPYIHSKSLPFPRGSSILQSIKCILLLVTFFRRYKFDMVQYSTPNASFCSSISSWFCHIPIRLYCQWGMVYVTMKGLKRLFFKRIEKLVCCLSTHIQPDSKGNLLFCRKEGLYTVNKSCVIWNGSAKGVDLTVFDVSKKEENSSFIRKKFCISSDAPVIGFVGRLGRDKGCNELLRSFKRIKVVYQNAILLFVGPIEKEDTIDPELLEYFYSCSDIIKTGRITDVYRYMSAMDIFVLPSYREGFGMSVVEASAMEIPVIVTVYPGPGDAMVDNLTGFSVPVADEMALTDKICYLLNNPILAKRLGCQGRAFVEKNFDQKQFRYHYLKNRLQLLGLK